MAGFDPAAEKERIAGAEVLPSARSQLAFFLSMAETVGHEPAGGLRWWSPRKRASKNSVGLELWLSGGERLQIGAGVDASTLRTVLAVLRERQRFTCRRVCAYICAGRRVICLPPLPIVPVHRIRLQERRHNRNMFLVYALVVA